MGLQKPRRGHPILGQFVPVELRLHLASRVVVAWIAAERGEAVRSERHVSGETGAPRDVLDVRVESAVLVNDHDAGKLTARPRGTGGVGLDLAVAFGGVVLHVFRLQAVIVLRDLLGLGVFRAQSLEKRRRGHTGGRVRLGPIEELAAVERAVNVAVEEIEKPRMEIARFQSRHVGQASLSAAF